MAYEYVAISKHPDDVISLSVGHQAQKYPFKLMIIPTKIDLLFFALEVKST